MSRPSAVIEEAGYLPSGGGQVYAFLSRPRERAPGPAGVVILGPFAEEKKSSLRALVEAARAFAARGLVALRIDFRGTGDSSGRSEELSLGTMIEDAVSAAEELRVAEGCGRIALVGLRLGAAVALLSAVRARADALVLLAPVVSGAGYVRELSRRQAIRRMLTRGDSRTAGAEAEGPFDLDGLAVDRAFMESLRRLELVDRARELRSKGPPRARVRPSAVRPDVRALVMEVGARKRPSAEAARLGEALGVNSRVEVAVSEPFWLQTDYVDPGPAVARVAAFLEQALAPGTPGAPGGAGVAGTREEAAGE